MSNKSRPPRNPISQVSELITTHAIYSRKSKDTKRHGPRVGPDSRASGIIEVWRGGVRYQVVKGGLRRCK